MSYQRSHYDRNLQPAFHAGLWPRRTAFALRRMFPTSLDRPHISVSCSSSMRLLIVAILACCPSALSQELTLPVPPENQFHSSGLDPRQPAESMPQVGGCSDGFWFVSTHLSPQSFDDPCPKFRPCVSRYEDCSSFRRTGFHELSASLIPGMPVCLFVHGSFVDMPSAGKESICTWKWLRDAGVGQPMQMIYLYWPSFKKMSLTVQCDVNQLGRQAARNGYYLAELLQHIPRECPVCLIGHSHGTRVIASGLHLMAGGAVQRIRHPFARVNGLRIRSVFVASALDHDWLNPGHKYDRALCSTECLLNMTNRHDRALRIYPLRLPLISRRALGLKGLSKWDRSRLGPNGRKVLDYDVTPAIGNEHLWPYYFSNPGLAMAMRNYVYFPEQSQAISSAMSLDSVMK